MAGRNDEHVTRRRFVGQTAAAVALTPAVATTLMARSAGAETLNVGVVGCGGRGTGAAHNAVAASPDVRIVALADLFPDRLAGCRQNLAPLGDRAIVEDRHCYVGFDACERLLADADVDVVILATPPHFRPMQFEAAVAAGKHVFMEKPVAVDPAGIRRVLAAAETSEKNGLCVVAGTQRRHERSYLAAMEAISRGAIGDVIAARCFWNMGGLWVKQPRPEWSDMEWQLRNWLYFTWLSGDHIVEQHVHNLDIVNWAMGAHPVRAIGVGGREVRTQPEYGHIFDHHAIDYEYPDGQFMLSMCRQIDGCPGRVEEVLHGSKGRMWLAPGRAVVVGAGGEETWRFDAENPSPYVEEHVHLQEAIRSGRQLNEARRVAEATLTAIMGRMATYTGQTVTWEQALDSKLDLSPPAYEFGAIEVPPVAVPGRTKLI